MLSLTMSLYAGVCVSLYACDRVVCVFAQICLSLCRLVLCVSLSVSEALWSLLHKSLSLFLFVTPSSPPLFYPCVWYSLTPLLFSYTPALFRFSSLSFFTNNALFLACSHATPTRVLCSGLHNVPKIPHFDGLDNFRGKVCVARARTHTHTQCLHVRCSVHVSVFACAV